MQTFLPYPDFEETAKCLDWRRLGKQRVEAWQILRVLRGESRGWRNHPAVKMWAGYEKALCSYGYAICTEWRLRQYQDTMRDRFALEFQMLAGNLTAPPWLGDPAFHLAHRSNLIRKDPVHYGALWPGVPSDLPYVWPGA